MSPNTTRMQDLRILITVKTYPLPSTKYRELVCTAGVKENGDFIRLYPIDFRRLDYIRKYKKYQWIEVSATKHTGRDNRKESFRPDIDSIQLGEHIPPGEGNWDWRARYALAQQSASMEELYDKRDLDKTSLGVIKPRSILDLEVSPDSDNWKPSQQAALLRIGLWDDPQVKTKPLRKVPFRFHYRFKCDDSRCTGHRMSIHNWEAGALYWNLVDDEATPHEAAASVKSKFLDVLCGDDRDTHFFVGTMLDYPSWIVLGLFSPKISSLQLPFEF